MSDYYPYSFDRRAVGPLRLFGVRADLDGVRVANGEFEATFGALSAVVPISNIRSASVTGPYSWIKALGPRLSLADHGLTFGTNTASGVCLEFDQPIDSVIGPWRHPGLTVTVAEPQKLVARLAEVVS